MALYFLWLILEDGVHFWPKAVDASIEAGEKNLLTE